MATYDVGNVLIKIETKAKSVEKTLDNLINKLNKVQTALAKVNETNLKIDKANLKLRQTTKEIGNIDKKSKSASKSFSSLFNLGKVYFLLNYFKRVGTSIGNVASEAINFNETLNKFQVSTKGYYDEALQFVNSLTRAFNLSTESVMNYQATFKNMLSALGQISEKTSYYLSESLTAMAIDYASLFNVSIETAMSQFESALSGQVRSIRSTSGYDITERTLYSVYQQIGGTKTMRQLTQTEKRLLIILALQKQIEETGAKGDFGKTIENTSNQLKQIQETLKDVSRWLGQLMMKWLKPLIQYVLAGTIALREMLQTLNIMADYTMPDFRSEEQKVKDGLDKATDSANDLEEALEQAKSVMLGFDKLNVLGSTNTSGIGTDVDMISQAIEQYSAFTSFAQNKANEIASSILTWAGFTYNATTQLWEFNHSLETTEEKIEFISDRFEFLFSKILNKVIELAPKLPNILESIIDGIVAFIDTELKVIGEKMGGIINVLDEFLRSSTDKFYNVISKLFDSIVSNILINIIKNLPQLITHITDSLTFTQIGLLDLITNIIGTILENLPIALGSFKGDMVEILITTLSNVFDTALPKLLSTIVTFLIKIAEVVFTFIPNLINGLFGSINDHNGDFWKELGQEYVDGWGMDGFAGDIANQWQESKNNFANAWMGIAENIKKLIPQLIDIKGVFEEVWAKVVDYFEKVADKFKEIWTNVKNWFNDNIVKPIGNFFINMINGVISGFESMLNFFIKGINKITSGLSKAWTWLGIDPIGEISEMTLEKIPALANGGVVTKPTMAMVGEYSGASSNPEIVSPESKMREVFVESMLPLVQAVVSGDQQVIQAINGLANRPIEMNGRKVSEAIYNDLQNVATRKGQQIFSRT